MKGFEKENFLKFFFLCGCYSFRQAGISFSGSKVFFQKSNFSIHGKRLSSGCSDFCDKYFPGGGHVFNFNRGLQHITSLANVSIWQENLLDISNITHFRRPWGRGGREFKSKQKDHVLLGHFLHMSEWPMWFDPQKLMLLLIWTLKKTVRDFFA